MSKKYNQPNLDNRFDRESKEWRELYQYHGSSKFIYENKKYRQTYALQMLGKGPGIILDLGCGSGSYFPYLESLGYEVIGVDSSANMVDLAHTEASDLKSATVVRGNALQLPFEDNTFDAILCVGLIEYLPSDEEFLKEIQRIIKPGGRIVLTLRNDLCIERKLWRFYSKIGINAIKTDYYYRQHNPRTFETLLHSLKFENIHKRFCHFYPLPWPISRIFKPLNNYLAHKMEKWFSGRNFDVLGSTYIASFETQKSNLKSEPIKLKNLTDSFRCLLTGKNLRKMEPEMLKKLNVKIASSELHNQNNVKLSPLEDAFISEDNQWIYPIKNQVPLLLQEEAIMFNFPI